MSSASQQQTYMPDPRRWKVLAVVSMALFMSLVDVSIVNVALPSIQNGLGASDSQLQWILAGYALTFGVGLVTFGRAGDLFGRGPLFILGVAVFTGTSVWAGFATDATWLNIARAIEGLGSGLISPQVIGMIQQYFRGAERARAFGVFGAVVAVAVAIGPMLGGILIHFGGPEDGWRWVFFVNIPVGVAAILLALAWIPKPMFTHRGKAHDDVSGEGGTPEGASEKPATERSATENPAGDRRSARVGKPARASRDLDPIGAVLLGIAVLAMLLPFVESGASLWVWASLPLGIVILGWWLYWENAYLRRGKSPMVNLKIFRITSFSNGTTIVGLYFLGMTSIWVLVALYFQEGLGHSAFDTGLVGLLSAALSGVSALWAGRLVAKHGRKVVIGGLISGVLGVAACILVVWLHSRGAASEWWLVASLSFIGIAQGSVISPNQALTLAEVPLEYAGSSGGIMQTVQRIGTSVGIAIITAVSFAVLGHSDWAAAFNVGFLVIGGIILLALAMAFVDLRQRHGEVVL